MPSDKPLPSVARLVRAYHDGIHGQRDNRADRHSGSIYDIWGGAAAVLFARQAMRDKDMFADVYFDFAGGPGLTDRVSFEYLLDRQTDAYGYGTAILARPTAGAGAGTIWQGTRILCDTTGESDGKRTEYAVAEDTDVSAGVLTLPVPIHSTVVGVGTAIETTSSDVPAPRLGDSLWDPSWTVVRLSCADGINYEFNDDLRARARADRSRKRVGYQAEVEQACLDEGAGQVASFASDYGGPNNDWGINAIYVGDSEFAGSLDLVRRCQIRLESVRVLGADLMVLPMAVRHLPIRATVLLGEDPARFDWLGVAEDIKRAIAATFTGKGSGFTYRRDAMAGAAYKCSTYVQKLQCTTPTSDATVLVGSPPSFPASLIHYTTSPAEIILVPQANQ